MKLMVATLTRHDRPQWLAECKASVKANLPEGARHVIADGCGQFQEKRWTLAKSAEFVAFVDDDDLVLDDALSLCMAALKQTGAGVAFTYEARIDAEGRRLPAEHKQRNLRDVAMHPRSLHHLAVIRGECIAPEVLEHAQRIGIGIDWLMRAYPALKHGAVQVPVIGYEWRQHDGATSRSQEWGDAYEAAMPALREVTRSWMKYDAPIQQLLPR